MKKICYTLRFFSSSSFTFAFVGLLLLVVAYPIFDFTKVLAQSTEENNINTVRRVADAFNTGNVSNVSEFISPSFNHESQVDPVRQLRGPEEFIDTVETYVLLFQISVTKSSRLLPKVIKSLLY